MNVIVLVSDALRASNLGCYGYDKDTSPHIDTIAKRGIRFSNAFSTSNSTDASFTTIFTGKYPASHGIRHHGSKVTETEKSYTTNLTFLPQILHENGYVTIGIDWLGKWHKWGYDYCGGVPNHIYNNKKADSGGEVHKNKAFKLFSSDLKKRLQSFSLIRSRCNWYYSLPPYARACVRKLVQFQDKTLQRSLFGRKSRPIATDSTALTDLAIEYIREYAGKKNFFLFVHYWDTHTPYTSPKSTVNDFLRRNHYPDRKLSPILEELSGKKSGHIIEKSVRGKTSKTIGKIMAHYDASIRYVDSNIGRLHRFLDEMNITDDTLVIVTANHGESLDEHDIFFNHHGLHDPQIQVPLIMSHPSINGGVVYDELVQHFDLVPTIIEMAGIDDIDIHFDGKSLMSLIHGGQWNRRYIFAEETLLQQKRVIRDNNYKYIKALNNDMCLYCKKYHSKGDEFFNVQTDPYELNNIIDDDIKHKEYRDELDQYINTLSKPEEGRQVTFDDEKEINEQLEALGYL
ncbi:MAG: sulfatase [Sedimentisphaerales bacterium]|nr:sulfatase [Sedimentisphaerales bacterium]